MSRAITTSFRHTYAHSDLARVSLHFNAFTAFSSVGSMSHIRSIAANEMQAILRRRYCLECMFDTSHNLRSRRHRIAPLMHPYPERTKHTRSSSKCTQLFLGLYSLSVKYCSSTRIARRLATSSRRPCQSVGKGKPAVSNDVGIVFKCPAACGLRSGREA
jgi:hypothetical protein